MKLRSWELLTFAGLLCSSLFITELAHADDSVYQLAYSAEFLPKDGHAAARIEVAQHGGRLRLLDFNAPPDRYTEFSGDGDITRTGERLIWTVPAEGGVLRYQARIDRRRGDSFDASMTADQAVMRLDDLFPPARARTLVGSASEATLMLSGPAGWSFESGYGRVDRPRAVVNAERRFVRPIGWLVAGDLGVRRDTISDRAIVVAAPKGSGFRRLDTLAFLNWTLPELLAIAPDFPRHLLIVGGRDQMWRGALSAPNSIYLHPARPLVSENATSTLLHELVHVAMSASPAEGDDWIAEGLAEYYSLTLLLRSGGISPRRYQTALADLQAWSERDQGRLADPSTGADTAYAVTLFRELDLELTAAGSSLDAVVSQLFAGTDVDRGTLEGLVAGALGRSSRVLSRVMNPDGCCR